jgi:hypothetical protein
MLKPAVLLVSLCALVWCQEYRATLLGVVTDSTQAGVAGARVTAINMDTQVESKAVSGRGGTYVIPLLPPGRYLLRVEQDGFKTFERSPVDLRVNDRLRLDASLELGQIESRVTVTAEAPLVEAATASRGQVIENLKVRDLPLSGRNPFTLTGLAAGVQYTGSMTASRPFDNGAIANFSINGGRSGVNEYQIDGIPDNANYTRLDIAYVPSVEATQEFKIQTNTYDAQYGRTSGGIVSLSIRPGTNSFHGAVYEYLRRTALEANQFASNANGQPRTEHVVDQYGFRIDGPVIIPRLYQGKGRTFFMFSLEKYRERQPASSVGTVPTALERAGDFSHSFAPGGGLYTIYDPFSTRVNPNYDRTRAVSLTNLQYVRDPFAGNMIPAARMDAVGREVAKDFPAPNVAGDPLTASNNLFADNPVTIPFINLISRVDHNLSSDWRLYARWNYNDRVAPKANPYDVHTRAEINGAAIRRNDGAVLDLAGNLSPRTVFSARIGLTRYTYYYTHAQRDLTTLGFPASLIAQLQIPDKYPRVTFDRYIPLSDTEVDRQFSTTYTAQANLQRISGRHNYKFGFEYRLMQFADAGQGDSFGTYDFTAAWTSIAPQVSDARSGNAVASMLLGAMNSGLATINATNLTSWHYPVLFFQDDWQLTRNISVNFGLRWDYESPAVDRHNEQNRGFDANFASPLQIPGYNLRGGMLFAGVNGNPRGAFNSDLNNLQPRAGIAWKMLSRHPLVFRAGIGEYFLPTVDTGGNLGFSRTSNAATSTADFRPFNVLSNPFPEGLLQPTGASLGLSSQLGGAVTYADPRRTIPHVWQFSAGFQYEVMPGTLLEATYVGSRSGELQVSRNVDALSLDQLSLGTATLNQVVPNPFFGVLPAGTSRGAQSTTQRRNLIVPFPQFSGVTATNLSLGTSWYNSLQLKLEQRLRYGVSLLASYTASKTMEAVSYLNATDQHTARELTSFDVPQRLAVSGVYELPFGPQKHFLAHGLRSHVAGNWQVASVGIFQSGTPMSLPDYYITGDPVLHGGQTLDHWFNTDRSIWIQRPPDTLRITSLRSPNIRRHTAPQVDLTLTREIRIRESHRLQFKATAFNASNTPIFNFPNTSPTSPLFGVVPVTQINSPRSIELAFRYSF